MLPLKRIRELADNPQTYLRGVAAYNAGKITRIVRRSHPFYAEHLAATVAENANLYHETELGLGPNEQVEFKRCDCSTHQRTGGFCKHLVAVLVHKYYADMLGGIPGEQAAATIHSDPAVTHMLDTYILEQDIPAASRYIQLEATLHLSPRGASVGFVLREARPYVVRDIGAFCEAMRRRTTAEYGSQLRFLHTPEQFVPTSRPLLDFLLRHFDEQKTALVENGSAPGVRFLRELSLSEAAVDEFFCLHRDQHVECVCGGESGTYLFTENDPSLTIAAQKTENGYIFTGGVSALLRGVKHLYLLTQGAFFCCSAAYATALTPLLSALRTGHGRVFVSEADLPLFCTTVLSAVKPYILMEGSWPDSEAYPLPEPAVTIYLDAETPSRITARAELTYDGGRVNPYVDKQTDFARNRPLEHRLCHLLQTYFTCFDPENGCLTMQGDDDELFRFLYSGVRELNAFGEVMATDRFRHLSLTEPPHVSVGVRVDNQLLQVDWSMENTAPEELAAILRQYRLKKTYYRLRDGRFLLLKDPQLMALSQMTAGLALSDKELSRGRIQLPAYRALYLSKVAADNPSLPFARDAAFRRIVARLDAFAGEKPKPPASLLPILRDYQTVGFGWLRSLEQLGCGGIMADEMGLGKTLQTITLLLDAKQRGITTPSLVVCPTSLVLNWEQEIRRFAPELSVLAVIGSADQREALLLGYQTTDVVITSYDMLKRDIPLYADKRFTYHILDEAQYIKNPHTQNARAVKAIRSEQRFALTGTPIENRVSELWSIFDFLMPGFLYSYSRFRTQFETPILRDGDDTARRQLRHLVEPFILRRLKKDVLKELPPKTEQVLLVPLNDEQQQLYTANLALARQQVRVPGTNKMAVLALLMRLRQLCCDPTLCYEEYRGGSAKLESCLELVQQGADNGHKILIFSQFTSLLDQLQKRLVKAHVPFYRLDGATPKEQRLARIEAFNRDDTPVFLISLKAGGTGLNLTSADMVIHFDPWWNLAVQEQATDRAHRIGQTRPVQIIKLIAKDTVEERILRMQQQKQDLADALIPVGEGVEGMSAETLRRILEDG